MRFDDHHKTPAEDRILAFDTLFTTNQIQKFKILLPFLDNQMQKQMAIMIKLMELQYAISYFRNHPYRLCGCFTQETNTDFHSLINAMSAYTDRRERQQMQQFMNVFQTMETYREVSQTMEMMKEFMPDLDLFGEGGIFGTSSDLNAAGSDTGRSTADSDTGRSTADSGNDRRVHGPGQTMYETKEVANRPEYNFFENQTQYHSSENHDYENNPNTRINDYLNSHRHNIQSENHSKNDLSETEKVPDSSINTAAADTADSIDSTGNENMIKMMMSMLTPEQMQMFEMFGGKQFE